MEKLAIQVRLDRYWGESRRRGDPQGRLLLSITGRLVRSLAASRASVAVDNSCKTPLLAVQFSNHEQRRWPAGQDAVADVEHLEAAAAEVQSPAAFAVGDHPAVEPRAEHQHDAGAEQGDQVMDRCERPDD